MTRLAKVTTEGLVPEEGGPAPDRLVSGSPRWRVWDREEAPGLHCGVWECTPGAFRLDYTEWEYCRLIEGRARVTGEDGTVIEAGPGDAILLRPGFRGVWETLETIRKDYVIRL